MDYPQMLYRPGTAIQWAGHSLDTLIVADAGEAAAARKDGWLTPAEILDPPVEAKSRKRRVK